MVNHSRWRWWAIALRGVAAIVFGALSFYAPGAALISLVILFGAYAVVDGIFALAVASRGPSPTRGAIMGRGVASLVAGVLVLLMPGLSTFALLLVIGAWAIVAGVLEVATAIRMRRELEHEWLLGFEGLLSILFGAALLISPLAGAIVLGLWVGAYAVVLGILLLTTAFQLRSHLRHQLTAAA